VSSSTCLIAGLRSLAILRRLRARCSGRLKLPLTPRARFLFGSDVNDYLESLHSDFSWRFTYTDDTIDGDRDRARRFEQKTAVLERIANFSTDAPDIFASYMRMDQKLRGTWLPI
jgi:hypothetical protein